MVLKKEEQTTYKTNDSRFPLPLLHQKGGGYNSFHFQMVYRQLRSKHRASHFGEQTSGVRLCLK
jgi:hypothetical protein